MRRDCDSQSPSLGDKILHGHKLHQNWVSHFMFPHLYEVPAMPAVTRGSPRIHAVLPKAAELWNWGVQMGLLLDGTLLGTRGWKISKRGSREFL